MLKPGNARKLLPNVILAARVLPLVDRTVVAVGNSLGHLVFWDADYPAAERAGGSRGAGGVFDYIPHKGSVGGITTHPAAPRKVMVPFLAVARFLMSNACSVPCVRGL